MLEQAILKLPLYSRLSSSTVDLRRHDCRWPRRLRTKRKSRPFEAEPRYHCGTEALPQTDEIYALCEACAAIDNRVDEGRLLNLIAVNKEAISKLPVRA